MASLTQFQQKLYTVLIIKSDHDTGALKWEFFAFLNNEITFLKEAT